VASDGQVGSGDWEDFDDEEFFAAWDKAEAHAVEVLRKALPQLISAEPREGALQTAADRIRAGYERADMAVRLHARAGRI
jgi:hypothetical protein